MKSDLAYQDHILHAIEKNEEYMAGVTFLDFVNDEEKQDAVIRKIQVNGEASKKVSKALKAAYPTIPWRSIAGMRDKLVHDYFEVDYETIWQVTLEDIPTLKEQMSDIIREKF